MKALFISNLSTERCGARAFGHEMVRALRTAGVSVDTYDGTYSSVAASGYLPPLAATYDIIHLNWDPQAINHYLPEHFAGLEDRLSLFLHDVPPNSTCPVQGVARWVFAHEPGEGIKVITHAVPDYSVPPCPLPERVVIGISGIRADRGMGQVQEVCHDLGWDVSKPGWWDGGAWLSTEEEILRLSRTTANACWYHTTGRGKSMAAMFGVAAGRPLVLSGSSMFSALAEYGFAEGIYRTPTAALDDFLLRGFLLQAVLAAQQGQKISPRIAEDLSWSRVIQPIVEAWTNR